MYSSITWLNLSEVTWFLYNKITSTKCISSHIISYKQMLHTIPLVIRGINTITDKEIKWCILNLFSITVSHFIDYMRMTSHTWRMHAYIVRVEKRLRSRNIFRREILWTFYWSLKTNNRPFACSWFDSTATIYM
jgi:hypothetical protein